MLKLLVERNTKGLLEWRRKARSALAVLSSFIYEEDDLVRWRSVEAMGRVAALESNADIERARSIVRRLLWSMNDDSGSVGWHAPEAIGEILYNVPALIEEYGIILSGFLRKSPFERGVHWAVWRLASKMPEIFAELKAELGKSAKDSDPYIRAYAAGALRQLGEKRAGIEEDGAQISVYDFDSGTLKQSTVAKFASS